MSTPLADLSPSRHNSRLNRSVDSNLDPKSDSLLKSPPDMAAALSITPPDNDDSGSAMSSPRKAFSPVKYRFQDDATIQSSPPGSPRDGDGTVRINDGLTRAIGVMEEDARNEEMAQQIPSEETGTVRHSAPKNTAYDEEDDDIDFTLNLTQNTQNHGGFDDTVGDLSSISAIPPDLTRFANLRSSPTKSNREAWSPSKQLRNSVLMNTPGAAQRPLQLLSRTNSITEDEEETPRKPRGSTDSPTDLLNFTGQTNILIPPPSSAPRTSRRSPSGRGAFPIKVNATPSHRAQASLDRERAGGRSPDKTVAATPTARHAHRHSMYGASNGLGLDLLDIDFEPMATPRSIPTVTPRELESLRSELQSKISGLEATLSGKEAEVKALTRAITDAEVRAGKVSEELRGEQAAREEMGHAKEDMERRCREMEEVLREVKQNAFVEEREREKLKRQIEEGERKTEDAEVRILELNASLETLRTDRLNSTPSPAKHPSTPGATIDIDTAVKNATESVARELHALYKTKHERKVADLKVSYEKRWVKQVEQLRTDLKASQDEVVKLQTEKEATMSGVIPGQSDAMMKMEGQIEELRRWNEDLTAQKKVAEAESAGFKSQIETLSNETNALRLDLEQERVEKGELVAQIDEFLLLKAEEEEIHAERARTQAALQQPVSPPRSEDGGIGSSTTRPTSMTSLQSPGKSSRNPCEPPATGRTPRARPMSMLQAPKGGKFSGIPAPGSGLKAPGGNVGGRVGYGGGRSGGLMEGIARMGAGAGAGGR